MDYLLDTNIIIVYSRDSKAAERIEAEHQFFDESNITLGELDAFVKKLGLGKARQNNIERIVDILAKVRIDTKEVINQYGEIDAFSQGQNKKRKGNFTARNMGKNDIWIAATASAYDLTLVTTDKDFDHLQGEYLKLCYVDIEKYRK